jgi:hypothetical protein
MASVFHERRAMILTSNRGFARVNAGAKELNEMVIGRTDDAEAFESVEVSGAGPRTPSVSGHAPSEPAGHMIALNPPSDFLFSSCLRPAVHTCQRLVRLLADEFAAHPVPGRQIADRRRSRQRLNGKILTVTPCQYRRCANASIHLHHT